MQAAVAVAEGGVAAVMRRLYVVMTVLGLLLWIVQVQVSVELVAEAAVLVVVVVVVVMVGAPVKAWLGMEGGSGDHR